MGAVCSEEQHGRRRESDDFDFGCSGADLADDEHLPHTPTRETSTSYSDSSPNPESALLEALKRHAHQNAEFVCCLRRSQFFDALDDVRCLPFMSKKILFLDNVLSDEARLAQLFDQFSTPTNADEIPIHEVAIAFAIFLNTNPPRKFAFMFSQADCSQSSLLGQSALEKLLHQVFSIVRVLLPDILSAQDMEHADGVTPLPGPQFYRELGAAFFRELLRKLPDLASRILRHASSKDGKVSRDEFVHWFTTHPTTDAYRLMISVESLLRVLEEQLINQPASSNPSPSSHRRNGTKS